MRIMIMLLLGTAGASAQGWAPPFCTGTNMALQYGQQGWICAQIAGAPGPAGPQGPTGPQGPAGTSAAMPAQPPPSQCITSNWDGKQWSCVPTEYLTSAPPVGRR
jgi:hypothetical protein